LGLPGVPLPPIGPIDPRLVQETTIGPTFYIPQYDGIQTSKDLAFALYTRTPEPGSLVLLSLGLLGLAGRRAWSRLKA
jgi:PEP-CTERM motif